MKRIVSFLMLLPIMVGVSVFTTSCSDDDQYMAFDIASGANAIEGIEAGGLDPNMELAGSLIFSAVNDPTSPQKDSIKVLSNLEWEYSTTGEDWFTVSVAKRDSESNSVVSGTLYVTIDNYEAESSVGSRVAYITLNASNGMTNKIAIVQYPLPNIPDNPTAEELRGEYKVRGEFRTAPSAIDLLSWSTKFYQMAIVDAENNIINLTNEMGSPDFSSDALPAFQFYFEVRKNSNGDMVPILNVRSLYPNAGGAGVHMFIGAAAYSGGSMIGFISELEGRWENATKSIIFPADPAVEVGIGLLAFDSGGTFLGRFSTLYKNLTFTAVKENSTYIGAFNQDQTIGRPKGSPAATSKSPQLNRVMEIISN